MDSEQKSSDIAGTASGVEKNADQIVASRQETEEKEPDVYSIFSPRRKSLITALVSYNAFISPMTASIFLPSIPEIATDLSTTPTIVNVTVAIFIV